MIMIYLLDTCVISELIKVNSCSNVVNWIDSKDEEGLFLSVITIGEIEKGITKLEDSKRKTRIEKWLMEKLLMRFKDRIIPLDINILLKWGQMTADLEKKGKKMSSIDSLIAATALEKDLTLVTRNVRDFENSGVEIINPWTIVL